jgi:alanine racemase
LSSKGAAVLHGVRVPIAGRVSMDLITLDVSDLAEPPHVGEEVELLGDTISLGEVAELAGTNEYEILTRLRRVPRIYDGASARAGATKDGASARAGATGKTHQ